MCVVSKTHFKVKIVLFAKLQMKNNRKKHKKTIIPPKKARNLPGSRQSAKGEVLSLD